MNGIFRIHTIPAPKYSIFPAVPAPPSRKAPPRRPPNRLQTLERAFFYPATRYFIPGLPNFDPGIDNFPPNLDNFDPGLYDFESG